VGYRGPTPKRDSERIRRNIPEVPTETIQVIGTVEIPELGDIGFMGEIHPLVSDMYQAMKDSACAKFFEPTDWCYARLALHTLNAELVSAAHQGRPIGAMKTTAINQMLSALLLTEGDRRRARLEIERAQTGDAGGKVLDVTDLLKQRLAAGGG
jgi:hypothetical protein